MAGVKTLADAKIRLSILTTPPADLKAITLAELEAGIEVSCQVAKNGTRFSPTASDTMSDPAFCDEGNASTLGASNYEASIAPYWYLDLETGKYEASDNPAYEAVKLKGTELTYVLREGPHYSVPWAAGDIYEAYVATSDNPTRPTETGGNIKRLVKLLVQRAELNGTVTGA
mgnify:CR=1 FL=1